MNVNYIPKSKNVKTGNIPQQFIGDTKAENYASCVGCPLLEKVCYAQNGTERFYVLSAILKAKGRGKDYSLKNALKTVAKSAKFFRFGSLGDPSAMGKEQYFTDEAEVRKAGFGVLSYTHFWKSKGAFLKGHAMASCDTWDEADEAVKQGWRAAVHVNDLPEAKAYDGRYDVVKMKKLLQGKTKGGSSYTVCPSQRTENRITCNDCGLCDASRKAVDIVVFLEHGKGRFKKTMLERFGLK